MLKLDTRDLVDLNSAEADRISAETGNRLRFEVRQMSALGRDGKISQVRARTAMIVNDRILKVDTTIETEIGSMTLMEFWKSDHQKLRCQATFRESSSWNGILGLHDDFAPFLFDNGVRIKYVLPDEELGRWITEAWIGRLTDMTREEILECWTDALRKMDETQRRRILDWVQEQTKQGLQLLKDVLKAAQEEWDHERIKATNGSILEDIKSGGRVPIVYDSANLPEILPKVETAIFSDKKHDIVLTHTQGLVTVCEKRPTSVREVMRENAADGADNSLGLRISRYQQHELGIRAMESCAFLKEGGNGLLTEIAAPPKLVHTMLEASFKRAPALVGIIEHPAVKDDGSLVEGDGFDPNTGFYIRVPKALVAVLPEVITQQMAATSFRWMCEKVLADFPFASELDRTGAVAMMLTAIQRRMMTGCEGAPMFATSAPVQSTGKTALVRLVNYLVHGVGLPVTSWPSNDEEMGKHLLAILMEGLPIVLFDNLPEGGRIESDELAKACTAEKYRRRILGENREGEAPTNVVWCFTGNNIQPVGDFNTRTISIYLDANCENPDRRSYSRDDLESWCLEHRKEFFYHALMILAGYRRHQLSCQEKRKRVANEPTRFQDWDRQVREPLIWAGAPDPAQLFERNKAEDPQKAGREVLLETWFNVYGNTPVQLKQILEDCDNTWTEARKHGLHDAISDLVPFGRLNSKSFATLLQKFINQWLGGYRLQKAEQSTRSKSSAKWFVEREQEARRHAAE
ncbi:MAG: hypothetical protein FJW24_02100 [Acidimicrobiia bacterium]|nr:hypothetical protein [Acidimicrobiia bacterium]MBM4134987.1 hypothetical protein [Nitrospira sp.]